MIVLYRRYPEWKKPNKNIINFLLILLGVGFGRARKIVVKISGRWELPITKYSWRHYRWCSNYFSKKKLILGQHLIELRKRNRKLYKKIHCYRGIRLINYLPSRGQRTKSNGITSRYLESGTFEYVPTRPGNFKKILSYTRRSELIKKESEVGYQKKLRVNFAKFKSRIKKEFNMVQRKGQWGSFRQFVPRPGKKNPRKLKNLDL